MSAVNMASGADVENENIEDLENRITWRSQKNLPVQQKATQQRRVALGNITSNVRLQPTRTKSCNNQTRIKNEKVPKCEAGRGKLVSDATASLRAFTIHQDEDKHKLSAQIKLTESVTALKDLTECKSSSSSTIKTETQSKETTFCSDSLISLSSDVSEADVDSFADSPMVLDLSILDSRIQEVRTLAKDVFLVPEYSEDIYRCQREAELRNRAKPGYLKKQSDITAGMRSILVDWLVEVAEEYKLQDETLYLAVSYIDRFLSCMSVLRGKLQLVGTASMFIASKFEEIYPPDLGEFVYITDDTYTKKQVLRMEHLILKVLSFDLVVPTTLFFLSRFCKCDDVDETTESLASYLSELTLLEAEPYLSFFPSVVAASAICLANHTMGRQPWSAQLSESSGYELHEFEDCLHYLYRTYCNAATYPQQAIREKYKATRYRQVSLINPPTRLPF